MMERSRQGDLQVEFVESRSKGFAFQHMGLLIDYFISVLVSMTL